MHDETVRRGLEAPTVGAWLLAGSIILSALALGALHTPVLAGCAVLAAIGTALVWRKEQPFTLRPAALALVGVSIALLAWTLFQLVPWPRALVETMARANADVWARSLSPLREAGPRWLPLSLDPPATRVQLLRGVTYLVVFLGALRLARRGQGVVFLERTLLASVTAISAAAVLHPAVGAKKVFGVYAPDHPTAYDVNHLAPLLNTNHLAAYVNIGMALAFACVLERREALPRLPALVLTLLFGAMTAWTWSRGGMATMVLAALIVVVLSFGARRARRAQIVGPVAVTAVAMGAALILVFAAFDDSRAKILRNDLSKLSLIRNSLELTQSFPIFGIGRGAFESVFPSIRRGTGYWVFTHPENIVAQWVCEWGLPVSIAAFVALGWTLRPRTALERSRPPIGAWAALVAVATQNLVDFSSEVPGVMMALSVCAAIVTGGTGGARTSTRPPVAFAWRPRVVSGLSLVATAAAIAVTLPFGAGELYAEQTSVSDLVLGGSLDRPSFQARIRAAMLRHPAEAYFPYVGAVRATVSRDESMIPWAARALERSPVLGRAHLLLARSLFVRAPSQARLEYRTACLQDERLCALDEALPLVATYEDAMELVPDGAAGVPVLAHLGERLALRLPATVVRLDRELSARDSGARGPVERAAARALGDARDREPWCSREGERGVERACVAEGLEAAARLRSAAPHACEGHALTAELRFLLGETELALGELQRAIDEVEDRSICARRLVTLAVSAGSEGRITAALDRLLKLGCESPAECVTNYTFSAGVESSRGAHRRALTLLKKACELAPEREDLLAELAARAEAQGVFGEALDAYTKLADRNPQDATWKDAAMRVRSAASRGAFERK